MSQAAREGSGRSLRRGRAGGRQRVTHVELLFDLVYVFAVTQLSHYLLSNLTLTGALQVGLLLVMVWLLWAYTTWAANWLDPGRIPVRLLLLSASTCSAGRPASTPRAWAGPARENGTSRADTSPSGARPSS